MNDRLAPVPDPDFAEAEQLLARCRIYGTPDPLDELAELLADQGRLHDAAEDQATLARLKDVLASLVLERDQRRARFNAGRVQRRLQAQIYLEAYDVILKRLLDALEEE